MIQIGKPSIDATDIEMADATVEQNLACIQAKVEAQLAVVDNVVAAEFLVGFGKKKRRRMSC